MERVWITNGSTSVVPVVNPLAAACHDEFVPTDIYVLDNPVISDVTDGATSLMKTVVDFVGILVGSNASMVSVTVLPLCLVAWLVVCGARRIPVCPTQVPAQPTPKSRRS